MRHRKNGLKLNMTSSHRDAMFRNMVTSLLKHDQIKTTSTRAKELRSWADHVITLAKRGDLHARRQALAIVREKSVVHKLFEDAKKRFALSEGGYTRVVKIGKRAGDAASMSIIQLVAEPTKKPERKSLKEKGQPAAAKQTTAKTEPAPAKEEQPAAPSETESIEVAPPAEAQKPDGPIDAAVSDDSTKEEKDI